MRGLEPGRRALVAAALVIAVWGGIEGALARRPDLDDHARWAASLSLTIARNYLRHGFREAAKPLANGGPYELAREAPYLDQPTADHVAAALWFEAFGLSIPAARARTVVWGLLALVALALGAARVPGARASPALLALAFGTIPIVAFYDHAAFPPAVAVSALAIATGARLARLSGAGTGALVVQALALAVLIGTSWKGILFAGVWAVSDGREKRRDGLLLLGLALVLVAGEVGYLAAQGGAAAWLAKGAKRAGSPGPALVALGRVLRYGRGLGYGHALLGAVWAFAAFGRARRGASTTADRVALELFLAPVPWFLVFRERVANHDHEMLSLAPALAVAAWQTLSDVSAGRRGRLRVALLAAMLVVTGAGVAAVLEHRDDWDEPRRLGAVAREVAAPAEALATDSTEFSVIWEADRFVHLRVASAADLAALLARGGPTKPRYFILPAREADSPLGRDLSKRYPSSRRDDALVFELAP